MFHKKATFNVAHFQIIAAPSAHLLIIRGRAHMGPFGRWYLAGKGRRSLFYVHQNLHPPHLRTQPHFHAKVEHGDFIGKFNLGVFINNY